MEAVYLETTFVSYLVALPARDLVIAGHQQVTRDWWQRRRTQFRLLISQVVLEEVSAGDEAEVQKRLEVVRPLQVLSASPDAEALTTAIIEAVLFRRRPCGTQRTLPLRQSTAYNTC